MLSKKQIQAARRLLELEKAGTNFLDFSKLMEPKFEFQFFQTEICTILNRLEQGTLLHKGKKCTRVMFNLPPRHGKSTLITHLFPAYYMGRDPRRNVLSTTYSTPLASTFGQKVKNYVEHPDFKLVFPRFQIRSDTRAKDDWMTLADAGHDGGGQYYGTGVGGPTTGRPANFLLLDDPVKNRVEAESITYRNRVWDFYISSLENRKEPAASGEEPIEVVVLTRWHPDDLGGRLQFTEDWKNDLWMHVNYPAIREIETGETIRRDLLAHDHPAYLKSYPCSQLKPEDQFHAITEEKALWEDRFPLTELHRKRKLDEREFAALYQQSPYIKGGNIIKDNWWRYYDPNDLESIQFQSIIIAVDSGFKVKESNSYSALGTFGLATTGDIYVIDVIRQRFEFPELKRQLVTLNNRWRGKGLRAFYVEDRASGQSIIQELRRESGLAIIPHKVSFDKLSRLLAVTPLIEGGRVLLPSHGKWLDAFMQECLEFPNSKFDDQVDMLSMGLDVLSRQTISMEEMDLALSPMGSLNNLGPGAAADSLASRILGKRNPRTLGQ